jgi:hypothetical protein
MLTCTPPAEGSTFGPVEAVNETGWWFVAPLWRLNDDASASAAGCLKPV